ncbi:hypothetical protein A3A67_04020 [Candidatus Peribacteria bacterium RIFCSPLOWO2_01_FULL_51_18]|nr:MAG: hypothetical protein A3C52_05410 [Candidatus Peribacteria bacterium RIFCSPHIGHO2_02_FULL_51_15]OGJ66791.1 MAG: hypothetical protein A3A67_04020 [Candidatus Peribacteria bacterium RIFCSPLOWO2_01_FULL_51_18]
MALHKKKYQNAVLYLCQELRGEVRGKKKLAKLLYFIDFDFYEKYAKSITGDIYKALPMGPVPSALVSVTEEMIKMKILEVKKENEYEGYIPTEIYRSIKKPDLSIFSEEEIRMLKRVVKRYGHLSGKQLQDLTHAEAPYTAAKPNEEVPYEFTYYRGTDFNDL